MNIDIDRIKYLMRERYQVDQSADVIIKSAAMEVTADSANDYRVTARITTDSTDEDKEILIPDGMVSTRFDKSGAVFWIHDYSKPVAKPYGKLKRGKREIIASAEFPRRPEDFEGEFFPDYVRALVKQGIVRGVSVGLIPIITRTPTAKDREDFGDEAQRIVSRWILLEWSFAPVQCNPDAMVIDAMGKGILNAAVAKQLFNVDVPATQVRVNLECEARAIELADTHVDPDEWDGAIQRSADNSNHFLGIDTMQPEGSEGHWLYPIITMDNRVNRKAVDSVLSQARKAGHETIATAATRIIAACDAPNAPKAIRLVTHPINAPMPIVKHVHKTISRPRPELDIPRMVKRKIQKLRGAIYEH